MVGRVLVTGGAGFIGSHVVDALVSRGEDVVILDALTEPVHSRGDWPAYLPPGIHRVLGDVREAAKWIEALQGVDRVVHAAAYQDCRPDYSTYYTVNAAGTALLYEVARATRMKLRKVVILSTQGVYGEGRYSCARHGSMFPEPRRDSDLEQGRWSQRCPICAESLSAEATRESDPARGLSIYGLSKHAGERAALALAAMTETPTAAARLSIVIGPRQTPRNLYSGALRSFSVSILHHAPVLMFEDGEQLRDFTAVADVASALLLLLDDDRSGGRLFNVGGGSAISVRTLLAEVERATGDRAIDVLGGHYRIGETRDIVSDVTLLRSLGWQPSVSLEDAVQGYVDWLRESGLWRSVAPVSLERLRSEGAIRSVRR